MMTSQRRDKVVPNKDKRRNGKTSETSIFKRKKDKKDKEEMNGPDDSRSELQDTSTIGEFLWNDEDDKDRQDTQGLLEERDTSIDIHEPPHHDHIETILRLVEERHDKPLKRFKSSALERRTG